MAQNVALVTRDTWQNVATVDRTAAAVAPVITTTALPDGAVGVAYSQVIQATGTEPITAAVQSGSLPTSLSLNASTRVLSGAPTTPVLASFTVRATNSAGFDDQALTLLVPNEGSGGTGPVVTTVTLVPVTQSVQELLTVDLVMMVEDQDGNPVVNIVGVVGSTNQSVATATQLAPTDSNGIATIRVSGLLQGSSDVTVTVDGVQSNASAITVTAVPVAPTITTTSLPDGQVGVAYSQTLAATGDTPITWTVESGSLPTGLSLNASTGAISGTPTVDGTSPFTVRATNVAGFAQQPMTIVIAAAVVAPSVTTTTLPGAVAGVAYSATLAATGTAPITWSIPVGTLPTGLSLDANTGAITGTPGASGVAAFTARATNSAGFSQQSLTITVLVVPLVTTASLPAAQVGVAYSQTLAASGSTPITWSVVAGDLPSGLSLNASTGAITGTPDVASTANFTVHAINAAGWNQKVLSIVVVPSVDTAVLVLQEIDPFTQQIFIRGGAATRSKSIYVPAQDTHFVIPS